MQAKNETIKGERLFYALVDFSKSPTAIFIVPSAVVAEAIRLDNIHWLATPGRRGQKHEANNIRQLREANSETRYWKKGENPYALGWLNLYREAWHLLGVGANAKANGKDLPVN